MSQNISTCIDYEELCRIINFTIRKRGLSYREIEAETGIDHATLQRIAKGKPAVPRNFLALAQWCGYGLIPIAHTKATGAEANEAADLLELIEDECLDLTAENHPIADTGDVDGLWYVHRRWSGPKDHELIAMGETALEALREAREKLAAGQPKGGA